MLEMLFLYLLFFCCVTFECVYADNHCTIHNNIYSLISVCFTDNGAYASFVQQFNEFAF